MIKTYIKVLYISALFFSSFFINAQVQREVPPPYNIKTAYFSKTDGNKYPFFRMGEPITFAFDDLFGNEANYYYSLTHCNYDWTQSQLSMNEYIDGFDSQRIQNYENSFNTLQIYSRYVLTFPNNFTRLTKSGNYLLKILNEDRQVVFSRRFIVYEEHVAVPLQIKRARDLDVVQEKHNLDFAIKPNGVLQNPLQNIKVMLMQNARFDNAIYNIKPQYTIGNDLIYKYDRETQFWAGNEYHYFENKDIRNAVNNVLRITAGEIYNTMLYTNEERAKKPYTFYPDINGDFVINNINLSVTNPNLESDYTWVFFSLSAPSFTQKKDIYIGGLFNNYTKTPEYKMDFNAERGVYEKAVMIKQGFTNYMYTVTDSKGNIDGNNAVDGNFYQTENDYHVIVYYRENNARYDKVIGMGYANSENIIN